MQTEIENRLRADAESIFYAGVEAVDPARAVERHMEKEGTFLRIGVKRYQLSRFNRIFVIGVGKAGFPMARATEKILGDRVTEGIVVVKYGYGGNLARIKVVESSHPIPDEAGIRATQQVVSLLKKTDEGDLVIFLISGGGSALLPAPVGGVSLEEKQKVTQLLLDCGASIEEINAIRKHLSLMKGGQLARLAYPAHLQSLILSDVVGDRLDTIASGPTVPDQTTFKECQEIVRRYRLESSLPQPVITYLRKGLEGSVPETPKPGDPVFGTVDNLIIGSNILALRAARTKAKQLGYSPLILSSLIQGDTTEVANVHAAVAREIISSGNPIEAPACVLSGGETTVRIKGEGLGGRNQEFTLAACIAIRGMDKVLILSAGTDGTDGPTDAAGAFASGSTCEMAERKGIFARQFLEQNDSYTFFKRVGGLLITGPTNTNVMDLRILLVAKKT